MKLFGPGTDSGTFDYFTEEINGEEGASRADYSATENDNVIVQGVAGEPGALGYFGFSYFEQRAEPGQGQGRGDRQRGRLRRAERRDGAERRLHSRCHVRSSSTRRPPRSSGRKVRDFLTFMLDNVTEITEAAQFVPPTEEQLEKSRSALDAA